MSVENQPTSRACVSLRAALRRSHTVEGRLRSRENTISFELGEEETEKQKYSE